MRLLPFLFPLLVDLVLACFLFYIPVRASRLGLSDVTTGWLFVVFNVAYLIAALGLSRLVNERNAKVLMLLGGAAPAAIALLLLLDGIWPLITAVLALAVAVACFFVNFQLIMGSSTGMSPVRSSAWYAFSWSIGMSMGALLQGAVSDTPGGWFIAPMVIVPVILVVLAGLLHPRIVTVNHSNETIDSGTPVAHDRRYVAVGRIGIFVTVVTVFGTRGLLPKVALEDLAMSEWTIGLILACAGLAQALAALGCQRVQQWLYNPWAVAVAGVIGISGFALAASAPNQPWRLGIGIGLVGIFSGFWFYQAVVYAIMERATATRNIATNEMLVGLGSVAGAVICGYTAEYSGVRAVLLIPAGLIAVTLAVQMYWATRPDSAKN